MIEVIILINIEALKSQSASLVEVGWVEFGAALTKPLVNQPFSY